MIHRLKFIHRFDDAVQESAEQAREACFVVQAEAAKLRRDFRQVEAEAEKCGALLKQLHAAYDQVVSAASIALASLALRFKADSMNANASDAALRVGSTRILLM